MLNLHINNYPLILGTAAIDGQFTVIRVRKKQARPRRVSLSCLCVVAVRRTGGYLLDDARAGAAARGRATRAAARGRRGGAVGVLGAFLLLQFHPGDVAGHQRGLHLLHPGHLHAGLLGSELQCCFPIPRDVPLHQGAMCLYISFDVPLHQGAM